MTYPPRIQEFARRLYADGEGCSINEVREALRKRGYNPTRETVLYWVDPDFREEKLRRRRRFRPRGPARRKGWQLRFERMRELRENIGLSASSTARVMCHDFGLDLNRHQVEDLLAGRVKKIKTVKRLLYPQGAQS